MKYKITIATGIFFFLFISSHLIAAQEKPTLKITVTKSDTLIGICENNLEKPAFWQEVARFNRMDNPDLIHPGDVILIPAHLLKGKQVPATLRFAKGDVTVYSEATKEWQPLPLNNKIEEGNKVRTGAASSAEYEYEDGHTVLQRADTTVQVKTARSSSVSSRYRISLSAGRAVTRIMKATGKETRFQVETPTAIAGVRGTIFRSSVDPDGASRFEVFDDIVEVEAKNRTVQVKPGEGTLVSREEAPTQPRKLLSCPALLQPSPLYKKLPVRLAFEKVEGAVSYKILLANDKEIRDIIVEKVIPPQDTFDLITVEDGTYYLQSASIDELGLEGIPCAPVEIRVRANPVAPFIEIPHDQTVYSGASLTCKWLNVSDASRYHIQIAEDGEFGRLIQDESDITETEYATGNLAFKNYYFRVSSVASDNYQGEWSDTLMFTLELPPPTPPPAVEKPETGAKEITIRWQNLGEGITYRFQMASESSFNKVLFDQKAQHPEITLEKPKKAGTYYVRTGAIDQWGQEGKFSSPQSFEVKGSSRAGLLAVITAIVLILF